MYWICLTMISLCCESPSSLPPQPNCYTYWFLVNMTQGNPSPIPRAPFMQNQTDSMCRGDIFHILYVLIENSEWLKLHFFSLLSVWHNWHACLDEDPPQELIKPPVEQLKISIFSQSSQVLHFQNSSPVTCTYVVEPYYTCKCSTMFKW